MRCLLHFHPTIFQDPFSVLSSPHTDMIPTKETIQGVTFIHWSGVKSNQSKQSNPRLCIPSTWRVGMVQEEECGSRHRQGRVGGRGGGCYTPTALPLTCVRGSGGSGLRGGPTAGTWGARGASIEFPLTLMCSHPPWKTQREINDLPLTYVSTRGRSGGHNILEYFKTLFNKKK